MIPSISKTDSNREETSCSRQRQNDLLYHRPPTLHHRKSLVCNSSVVGGGRSPMHNSRTSTTSSLLLTAPNDPSLTMRRNSWNSTTDRGVGAGTIGNGSANNLIMKSQQSISPCRNSLHTNSTFGVSYHHPSTTTPSMDPTPMTITDQCKNRNAAAHSSFQRFPPCQNLPPSSVIPTNSKSHSMSIPSILVDDGCGASGGSLMIPDQASGSHIFRRSSGLLTHLSIPFDGEDECRLRGNSLPENITSSEYFSPHELYRLRNFSIEGKRVVNRGDSIRTRRDSRNDDRIFQSDKSHPLNQTHRRLSSVAVDPHRDPHSRLPPTTNTSSSRHSLSSSVLSPSRLTNNPLPIGALFPSTSTTDNNNNSVITSTFDTQSSPKTILDTYHQHHPPQFDNEGSTTGQEETGERKNYILVFGDTGVGKSTLVSHFQSSFRLDDGGGSASSGSNAPPTRVDSSLGGRFSIDDSCLSGESSLERRSRMRMGAASPRNDEERMRDADSNNNLLTILNECQMTDVYLLVDGREYELTFVEIKSSQSTSPSLKQTIEDCIKYFRPSGFLVIYSVVLESSFTFATNVLQILQNLNVIAKLTVILVASKTDMVKRRAIKSEVGRSLAVEKDVKFIETSPVINHNVDELLVGVITQLKLRNDKIKMKERRKSASANITTAVKASCLNLSSKLGHGLHSFKDKICYGMDKQDVRSYAKIKSTNLHIL